MSGKTNTKKKYMQREVRFNYYETTLFSEEKTVFTKIGSGKYSLSLGGLTSPLEVQFTFRPGVPEEMQDKEIEELFCFNLEEKLEKKYEDGYEDARVEIDEELEDAREELEEKLEDARSDAFDNGKDEGYQDGYDEGYDKGYNAGIQADKYKKD